MTDSTVAQWLALLPHSARDPCPIPALGDRNEIENLVNWCGNNNLSLNVNKTKEIVINFRKRKEEHASVYINGDEVERVESFRFSGVQITNNLSWSPPC